jgi:hypothetical protein
MHGLWHFQMQNIVCVCLFRSGGTAAQVFVIFHVINTVYFGCQTCSVFVASSPLVDHSTGWAHLLQGRIFYSPNCPRNINPPPPKPYYYTTSGIFNMPYPCLQHYWTPAWWTAPFRYLSFLLLYPLFDGYPFDCLAHIPPLDKVEDKFKLNSTLIESCKRLEHKLVIACALLV